MIAICLTLLIYNLVVVGVYLLADYLAFGLDKGVEMNILPNINKRESFWAMLKQVVGIFFVLTLVLFVLAFVIKLSGGVIFKGLIIFIFWTAAFNFAYFLNIKFKPIKITLQIIMATVVTAAWVVFPSWLTLDIAGLIVILWALANCKTLTFKQVLVLLIAVMIYDVVAVFGTGVMQIVALGAVKMHLPLMLTIPQSFSLASSALFKIGLGDIVLPGLMIMIAFREGRQRRLPAVSWATIGGYIVGGLVTVTILFLTHVPQPATIYLVPGVLIGFILVAWRHKFLREAWFD